MKIYATAENFAQKLLQFIDDSPTPWHVVANAESKLKEHGFFEFDLEKPLQKNSKYYFKKNGALIAFCLGSEKPQSIAMIATHTDSPSLRLKSKPVQISKKTALLEPEIYGSPILATFADRDLSLAGRVIDSDLNSHLIDFKTPLCRFINLPIHFMRDTKKEGLSYLPHKEINLIWADPHFSEHIDFNRFLENKIKKEVLSFDIIAYPTEKGSIWGLNKEFIAHRQLDNLISTFCALESFAENNNNKTKILALFDHEEIGSKSDSGAASVLMADILEIIFEFYHLNAAEKLKIKDKSFIISADASHAFHPNYLEKFDFQYTSIANRGVTIKIHRGRRYMSDFQYIAQFKKLLNAHHIPLQIYEQKANIPPGSTVGPILNADLAIGGVDLGVPVWAMHSARESAGILDCFYLKSTCSAFLDDF